MTCVACGGPMAPWLYMPVDGLKKEPTPHSSVARCGTCGLGALFPVPDPEEIPALYDIPDYYTHRDPLEAEPKPSLPDRILGKLAHLADHSEPFRPEIVAQSLKPDARICDLGCGHADHLRRFRDLGFEVIGVDPDPDARRQAAEAGVTVLDGTAESIPELEGKFDLVVMTHALEHCRDPKVAIANAFALTKGSCYIEVPNCASEHFRKFSVCSTMFDAPRHIHFFTPDCLALMAEQAGFKVARRSFVYYERNFSPGWRDYEMSIAAAVPSLSPVRHTFAASVALFLRSFWRVPERKYDSFGLWLDHSAAP